MSDTQQVSAATMKRPEVLETEHGDLWLDGHHEPVPAALAVFAYATDPDFWALPRDDAFDFAATADYRQEWWKEDPDDAGEEGRLLRTAQDDPDARPFTRVVTDG